MGPKTARSMDAYKRAAEMPAASLFAIAVGIAQEYMKFYRHDKEAALMFIRMGNEHEVFNMARANRYRDMAYSVMAPFRVMFHDSAILREIELADVRISLVK